MDAFLVRPDFGYGGDSPALIFIDGPYHESAHQQRLDDAKTTALKDAGYEVIRFPKEQETWLALLGRYPDVFGKGDGI